jgi:type IV pilus assembly protein PilY1
MKNTKNHKIASLLIGATLALASARAPAEDIDIFVGSSGGSAAAPNVMILIDNSPNWSRASQQWPDEPTQGQAELLALSSVLNSFTNPINVGLAMLTQSTPNGGYIRFGARDMTVAANKTALQNILAGINVNSSSEKLLGMANKDESAGLYELYKYFSGLAPYAGAPANNPNADAIGNTNPLTDQPQAVPNTTLSISPITPTTPERPDRQPMSHPAALARGPLFRQRNSTPGPMSGRNFSIARES